jgi:hypothetical protein
VRGRALPSNADCWRLSEVLTRHGFHGQDVSNIVADFYERSRATESDPRRWINTRRRIGVCAEHSGNLSLMIRATPACIIMAKFIAGYLKEISKQVTMLSD